MRTQAEVKHHKITTERADRKSRRVKGRSMTLTTQDIANAKARHDAKVKPEAAAPPALPPEKPAKAKAKTAKSASE